MQGTVWGSLFCTAIMDKLGKVKYNQEVMLYKYKGEVFQLLRWWMIEQMPKGVGLSLLRYVIYEFLKKVSGGPDRPVWLESTVHIFKCEKLNHIEYPVLKKYLALFMTNIFKLKWFGTYF